MTVYQWGWRVDEMPKTASQWREVGAVYMDFATEWETRNHVESVNKYPGWRVVAVRRRALKDQPWEEA